MSESAPPTRKPASRRWLWVTLAGGALGVAALTLRPSVPADQGKTVFDWMMETRSSRLESNPGLSAIGTNAVPHLARALAMRRTPYERFSLVSDRRVQGVLKRFGAGPRWTRSSADIRAKAAYALLAFGFEARPALPELHAELLNPHAADRQTVIHCLSEIGLLPESIPYLVQAWPLATNEAYVVRHDLLNAIGHAGTNAIPLALPIVVAALDDPHPGVRIIAANALERWAQPAPAAVPRLVSLISGTNLWLAAAAGGALGRVTNRADDAIPALCQLLPRSTNDYGRATVSITLWRLGEDAEETRRFLESLLTHKEGRGPAAQYLGEMGTAARSAVPALLRASHEKLNAWVDDHDRAQCARAVLRIQGESPEAIAVLEETLAFDQTHNAWIRATVAEQVGALGSLGVPLIPALRRALQDPDRLVRHEAAKALARLEAQAR